MDRAKSAADAFGGVAVQADVSSEGAVEDAVAAAIDGLGMAVSWSAVLVSD